MDEDEFEWDDDKAAENLRKHGVGFEMARAVFDDPFACDFEDQRVLYNEPRFSILGMVDNRILYVAYTLRDQRTRIISARGGEPHERRIYHEENTH